VNDLDKALADIVEIKSRLARSSEFLGLGPAALAGSGALALIVAAAQSVLPGATEPLPFFAAWVFTAIAACGLIGAEMVRRSRRHHAGLADQMIREAVLCFVPSGVAGAALLAFFARYQPDLLWLLPGLWSVLVSLGIFAAARSLPSGTIYAAAWYFLCGFTALFAAAGNNELNPWSMGLPFALGQGGLALLVHRHAGPSHDR
jgi:hypothetical protein